MTSAPAGDRCPATTAARRTTSSRCHSPVGTQVLHAVGIAMGAWVRGDNIVADHELRRGDRQPGRGPRGDELRRRPQAAGDLRLREQRLRDQRAARPAGGRRLGRGPRGRLRDAGRRSSTAATSSAATPPPRRRIERALRGDGPTLIEARVVRLTSHSSDDDQRRYRDPAEVEALKERDPIPMFANELRSGRRADR